MLGLLPNLALWCRGYLNYYSVYLFWLGSAVFIHLPSFQSMGIDVKADISMMLTIFLLSLLVCNAVHSAQLLIFSVFALLSATSDLLHTLRQIGRSWFAPLMFMFDGEVHLLAPGKISQLWRLACTMSNV